MCEIIKQPTESNGNEILSNFYIYKGHNLNGKRDFNQFQDRQTDRQTRVTLSTAAATAGHLSIINVAKFSHRSPVKWLPKIFQTYNL